MLSNELNGPKRQLTFMPFLTFSLDFEGVDELSTFATLALRLLVLESGEARFVAVLCKYRVWCCNCGPNLPGILWFSQMW